MVYAQASSLKDERELKEAVRVLAVARKLSSHPFLSPRLYSPMCAIGILCVYRSNELPQFSDASLFSYVFSTTCNTNVKKEGKRYSFNEFKMHIFPLLA